MARVWGRRQLQGGDAHARHPEGEVVDVVKYEFERDHLPVEEPDRLAILFVNSINGSLKVSAYAEKRRQGKTEPAGATTTPATASAPPQ